MKFVFLLALAGIVYTYLGYPALIWLLARLFPRRWKQAPITPGVSIVLAVHNGASLLNGKIQHLLGLDYAEIEQIIVVSDGSTDGTAEILARQSHPRLTPVILREHGGKAVAVNAGVALATAEIVLFVDIRPEIAPGAIAQLMSNFADPAVGCATGELILRAQAADATSQAVSGVYWRYEKWIRTSESSFRSPVGVYGGFYAIRRTLATPQPPGMILDDMFQPLAILRQGYRSVLDPRAFVYDTWPEKLGAEFHRKVRTLAGNFQLFQHAPWTLDPRSPFFLQLVSHKGMRLIAPYLMILLLASSLALAPGSPTCAAFAGVQILGWALAIAALRFRIPFLHRIASLASAMLVLNAAAVVGLYRFLFTPGPLWKIWNTQPKTTESALAGAGNSGLHVPPAVPDDGKM